MQYICIIIAGHLLYTCRMNMHDSLQCMHALYKVIIEMMGNHIMHIHVLLCTAPTIYHDCIISCHTDQWSNACLRGLSLSHH